MCSLINVAIPWDGIMIIIIIIIMVERMEDLSDAYGGLSV